MPEPGDPQSLNRYTYVLNSPLNLVDPTGHAFASPPTQDISIAGWANWQAKLVQGLAVVAGGRTTLRGEMLAVGASPVLIAGLMATVGASAGVAANRAAQVVGTAVAAASADGDPTNEVQAGMATLERLANNTNMYQQFRLGFQAQLDRAQYWLSQRALTGVDVPISGGKLDLTLAGNRAVEVKYWTQSYTAQHLRDLGQQLLKYQDAGYQLVLELMQTNTDPVSIEFYHNQVVPFLEEYGLRLLEGSGVIP